MKIVVDVSTKWRHKGFTANGPTEKELKMTNQVFTIEGYDNLFTVTDTRICADGTHSNTYGAIAADANGVQFHSFYVTPFPDMVEPY